MKKFFKNPCNLYFLLWSLYLCQGTLYATGSIVSQMCLLIILLMSLKEFFYCLTHRGQPPIIKGLNMLMFMFTFYAMMAIFTDGPVIHAKGGWEVSVINILKAYYISLLPIYVCYIYTQKGYLTLSLLQKWVVAFLVVAIMSYFRAQREAFQELIDRGSRREEITNNAGYIMMSLIPLMLVFERKRMLQYIGYAVCLVFVIMGMKRGAILIAAMSMVLILWNKLRMSKGSKKILVVGGSAVAFYVLSLFVEDFMASSDYFMARVEATLEGNSSGRDNLYAAFIDHFLYNASPVEMLFGGGQGHTLRVSTNYAHNDWLEILTNQGLLGVSFFFTYWLLFLKNSRKRHLHPVSRFCLFLIFCMYGAKTLFSMSINGMEIYVSAALGFALADGFRQLDVEKKY